MLTSISTDIKPESEIIIWASNHCHIHEGEIHSSPTHHWMETTQTLNLTEKGWSWKSGKENDEIFAHLIRIMYFLPYFFIIIISLIFTLSSLLIYCFTWTSQQCLWFQDFQTRGDASSGRRHNSTRVKVFGMALNWNRAFQKGNYICSTYLCKRCCNITGLLISMVLSHLFL